MANRDDELARHRAENARLAGLLEAHGIAWQAPVPAHTPAANASLSTDEKVALFRQLFRGRTDGLSCPLGKHDRQKRLLAGLCERMATRHLREAAHQVQ